MEIEFFVGVWRYVVECRNSNEWLTEKTPSVFNGTTRWVAGEKRVIVEASRREKKKKKKIDCERDREEVEKKKTKKKEIVRNDTSEELAYSFFQIEFLSSFWWNLLSDMINREFYLTNDLRSFSTRWRRRNRLIEQSTRSARSSTSPFSIGWSLTIANPSHSLFPASNVMMIYL